MFVDSVFCVCGEVLLERDLSLKEEANEWVYLLNLQCLIRNQMQ